MYNEDRILAIIPARGGSKGIPHKNIIDLCGKPLISYTIEEGLNSKYIDYLMVSTDDEEIATVAKCYGANVPFMRPPELAEDTSKTVDVVIHVRNKLQELNEFFSILVLLQPTAPLRTSTDIDSAIAEFYRCGCMPLVSVSDVDDHPLLIREIKDNKLVSLLNSSSTCRRQDMAKYYKVNGCIYINRLDEIDNNTSFNDNEISFVMEKAHSLDIDEPLDLCIAEYYIKNKE